MPTRPRRERPVPRANPSGKKVWRARPRDRAGNRVELGTFRLQGPCSAVGRADCCAQHAIDTFYQREGGVLARGTVGSYAETWLRLHPRSERTNGTNDFRLSRVLDIEIEGRPLAEWPFVELRRRHTNELIGRLLTDRGYAVEYVRGIVRVLSAMGEDAIDDDVAIGNPFKGAKLRNGDPRAALRLPREDRVWSIEEMHHFASCAGPYEPMVRMLADCGFRLGELLALQRPLQDLKRGTFQVKGSAHNGQVVPSSREKNHDRIGPIPPGCLSLLRAMPAHIDVPWLFPTPGNAHTRRPRIEWPSYDELAARLAESTYKALSAELGVSDNALRSHMRRHAPDAPPLAQPSGGKLWWARNFYRDVWEPTCERAGFAPVPKEFRSSLNSHLLAAGVNRADVADMLGHSEDVNAERYTRALRRSGDAIREVVG